MKYLKYLNKFNLIKKFYQKIDLNFNEKILITSITLFFLKEFN